MSKIRLTAVILLTMTLGSVLLAHAQTSNTTSHPVLLFVRDSNCNVKDSAAGVVNLQSDPSILLFESRKCNPILKPDSTQITLSEFIRVSGTASAFCTAAGTTATVQLSGLIANGVYTIWYIKVVPAPGEGLAGLGALGPPDGTGNVFKADSKGNAELAATSPAGPLSLFGSIGPCWLSDVFDDHLVAAYHIDGKAGGKSPGPAGTFVEQFAIIFEHP